MEDLLIFDGSGNYFLKAELDVLRNNVFFSASKLQDGLEVTLVADLKAADQYIVCHAMCDDIGTQFCLCFLNMLTKV